MAYRLPHLACTHLACTLLVSAAVPAQEWDAARAVARIKLICLGDYMIEKGGHPAVNTGDVDICHRALQHEDDEVALAGCRGMGTLARREFFQQTERKRLDEIVDLLIRRLRDELGVNLAGIQVILEMREKIETLQMGLEQVVHFVRDELEQELKGYCRRNEKAVIPKPLAQPPSRR